MSKINQNEKIVLFGAFNLASHVKGGHILIDTLKLLELKYLKEKSKKIRLITIGEKNNFRLDSNMIKWTHLGKVSSDKKLNLLYRASDVLVCPSLYCFGPHIVTEALLNDLPVFKKHCDIILANRIGEELSDIVDKVFTRDVYQVD